VVKTRDFLLSLGWWTVPWPTQVLISDVTYISHFWLQEGRLITAAVVLQKKSHLLSGHNCPRPWRECTTLNGIILDLCFLLPQIQLYIVTIVTVMVVLRLTVNCQLCVWCSFNVYAHRVDFTLTDSEDGNALLLDLAIYKYERLVNFNNFHTSTVQWCTPWHQGLGLETKSLEYFKTFSLIIPFDISAADTKPNNCFILFASTLWNK